MFGRYRDTRDDVWRLAPGMFGWIPRVGPIEPTRVRVSSERHVGPSRSPARKAFGMVPGFGRTDPGSRFDHRPCPSTRGSPPATGRTREGTGRLALDGGIGLCEDGAEFEREGGGGIACGGRDRKLPEFVVIVIANRIDRNS